MNETLDFLTQHGSLVLAAAVFAEQIGLPLPALPFLIAAGALAGTGQMAASVALVSAVVAAMAGDQVWFELGRRRGRGVLNWLCRISLEPTSCVRRTEDFFFPPWCPCVDRREVRAGLQHDCAAPGRDRGSLGATVPPLQWVGNLTLGWDRNWSRLDFQ